MIRDVNVAAVILSGFIAMSGQASSAGQALLDDARFDDDWQQKTGQVNEGDLRLLAPADRRHRHHHHTRVTIGGQSLVDGWVGLDQCHTGLDPVSSLQIVYQPGRVRRLQIVSSRNIATARVDGPAVELEDVQSDAAICVRLQSKALHEEAGAYVLRNGPFMRRFLDGYYPMRVSMEVSFPQNLLRYISSGPGEVSGLVAAAEGRVELDVSFEGRLITEINFAPVAGEN